MVGGDLSMVNVGGVWGVCVLSLDCVRTGFSDSGIVFAIRGLLFVGVGISGRVRFSV